MQALVEQITSFDNESAAVSFQADLRAIDSPGKIVAASCDAFGQYVDILVNNAGYSKAAALADLSVQDYEDHYNVNVRAVILLSKAVLPHLRSSGRIINISSIGARIGNANRSLYGSSKAAIEGLTRCWAAELGDAGHTVNTVDPGPVPTDILSDIPPELLESTKKATPMERRLGTTDDIAQIVAFLAEERSRWVTGQAISASGGLSMY